jgi:ATP-dependent Clp protease ATP-binding subunit ClpB
MFKPLRRSEIAQVVRLQLNALAEQMQAKGFAIQFSDEAVAYLAEAGFDPQFGARPLKRVIQREVVNELSKRLLAGSLNPAQGILVDRFDHNGIVFRNLPAATPALASALPE